MAQELFFTSAERGLAVGSFGYCTVARTARMSRNIQTRLEELSTYRPLFPAHDPRADLNPVTVSHTRVAADGQSYSVLSRIASAAPDYSGRTNYLAHHLLLDPSERSPAGPAWLALQPRTLATSWDGQVRELPAGGALPYGQVNPAVCHEWRRASPGRPGEGRRTRRAGTAAIFRCAAYCGAAPATSTACRELRGMARE